MTTDNEAVLEVLPALREQIDSLRALQTVAGLEEALADAGQQEAWFAMKATLQSIEGLVDEIGGILAS